MSAINSLTSGYLQPHIHRAHSSSASTGKVSVTGTTDVTPAVAAKADSPQLSPSAQLLTALQKFQQADPVQYQAIAQQISTAVQTAANTAHSTGNTTAASQLTQLAADFGHASQIGRLPAVQDPDVLAQTLAGAHKGFTLPAMPPAPQTAVALTPSETGTTTGPEFDPVLGLVPTA